ncbi:MULTISPECIES: hypothetical protein [Azospirillum]|uniref:Uncharacterized protein n=1 Tax=Azospirillum brasilense TaxID=192 RepID=A0ABU4PAA2_AZOBR|nr:MULTISPECIES: hypothetical protein [Azospirillum]MDW7554997.1 hypothetical protein [Azospirillum brasilense]MDW7594774.1 hypothetical protein [Azospirillum brasilense]MDW7629628.1 hypothetical protein [Azospirillum brasilense]MDX5954488.1 hypothetical protein [Azospirillum brasilense]
MPDGWKDLTFRLGGRVFQHPSAGPVLAVQDLKQQLERPQQQDQEFEDFPHPLISF